MHFNLQKRELTLKVVYYGPALSGKTTNLQALHAMAPQDCTGRLMTLETRDDRTLFFDLLPMAFRGRNGARVKLKLFTVPGQVIHDSTRKVVLQGADAVVFVADSQIAETDANKASFRNLRTNLQANGLDPELPLVIQFNKRDLPDIRSEAELRRLAQARSTPIRPAIALRGEGVRETLETLLRLTWQRLALEEKLGVPADAFLAQMFARWRPPRPVAGGAS